MNSWAFLLVLILCIGFGVAIGPARRLDRMDAYHLMHGPASSCVECEGK